MASINIGETIASAKRMSDTVKLVDGKRVRRSTDEILFQTQMELQGLAHEGGNGRRARKKILRRVRKALRTKLRNNRQRSAGGRNGDG